MNTDDKEIEGLLLRAQALYEVGRLKESLQLMHRVAALWPESNDIFVDIAGIYVDLGDYHQALFYTSKALRIAPKDGEAFCVRARAFLGQRKPSEAVDAARLALRYQPDSSAPYAILSEALLSAGKHEEAEEISTRLRELFPDELAGHVQMGCVTGARKRWAECESHNRVVLQLDPTNWVGLNNLGLALLKQGKRDEALEVFLRLAKLRPDYPNNVLNLSNFSPSELSGPTYDSLPPELHNLIKSMAKERRRRFPSRRALFLLVAIVPAPLYTLCAILLPAATFSTLTLALVVWTALVSAFIILRLPTPGIWKFNNLVALMGFGVWSLSYVTNVSGDAVNYNSMINLTALTILFSVSFINRAIYFKAQRNQKNIRHDPRRRMTTARAVSH